MTNSQRSSPPGQKPTVRITPLEAALELQERRAGRSNLISFCQQVDALYIDAAHLQLIASLLAKVEQYIASKGAEGIGRLIINLAPRHGKTLTICKRWPAYLFGRHVDWRTALVSYGADLSQDSSRAVRALIRDEPRYHTLFPDTKLSDDSQAVDRWALDGRSADDPTMVAVGMGGPLTGRGFNLIVIDDPLKSRAEAESVTVRKNQVEWYKGTLRTRLEPGGAIVIIMTRWHEDDLVGYLLGQQATDDGESWTVINLPALAETHDPQGRPISDPLGRNEGEALWPARYPRLALLTTKKAVGSYDWESEYQGHPKPPSGSKILRSWLQVIPVDQVPKGLRWARYWDLAISKNDGSSYTASGRCAYDKDGNLYLAAMIRGRWEWPEQKRIIKATMLAERELGVIHGVETALHGTAVVQEFREDKDLRGIPFKKVAVHKDKLTRALPWIAVAEDRHFFLVAGAWNGDFIEEAVVFTGLGDAYDDQIDVASGAEAILNPHRAGKLGQKQNPFYG